MFIILESITYDFLELTLVISTKLGSLYKLQIIWKPALPTSACLKYHFPSYLLKKSPEGFHQGILIKSKTVGCNIRASYSKLKMILLIKLKILAD